MVWYDDLTRSTTLDNGRSPYSSSAVKPMINTIWGCFFFFNGLPPAPFLWSIFGNIMSWWPMSFSPNHRKHETKSGESAIRHKTNGSSGVGKCPNWTSPNYGEHNLRQILESDIQNPQTGHLPIHVVCFFSICSRKGLCSTRPSTIGESNLSINISQPADLLMRFNMAQPQYKSSDAKRPMIMGMLQ